jgi:hypothetical protein
MNPLTDIDKEVEFTKNWWFSLIKDEDRMAKWLRKLEVTEIAGYYDWNDYRHDMFDQIGVREDAIFSNIADDEEKHSKILLDLMDSRRIIPQKRFHHSSEVKSQYWDEMNSHIVDIKSACAVNYFGEALAAFRFEVIQSVKETPSDIREALNIILPDEQFHRETLKRLAGDEALSLLLPVHLAAMAALKASK